MNDEMMLVSLIVRTGISSPTFVDRQAALKDLATFLGEKDGDVVTDRARGEMTRQIKILFGVMSEHSADVDDEFSRDMSSYFQEATRLLGLDKNLFPEAAMLLRGGDGRAEGSMPPSSRR